jgi:hypothetical protein
MGEDKPLLFTPDAAFSVHHKERDKSLLFFAEIDMATEDLANPDRSSGDLRHKILCYQRHFRGGGYKRYQDTWGLDFNGFRTLLVTVTPIRFTQLCKLVTAMPPSGFVWLTDQASLLAEGLWGPIWTRGGNHDSGREWLFGNEGPRIQSLLRPNPGP